MDCVVLWTIIVNTTTSLVFVGGLSRFTQALMAFRALRLITISQRLRDTFHAVFISGAVRFLEACVLMILYLIPFAIWG